MPDPTPTPTRSAERPILEVEGLVKHYPVTQGVLFKREVGRVKAVDGVDLELRRGETLGVVGESGCGKSTLARLLLAAEKPTAGSVRFEGRDIFALSRRDLRALRRRIQMVLQDPYSSLNPRMTVGDIVGEPFDIHPEVAPKGERRGRVKDLLEVVGLDPDHVNRYPHQFSGGQRQRVGIARALALRPDVIVCDEPVSALDVSVQAQVMNLLADLQNEFGLAYVFIAHDLAAVRHISDRVAVMYLGKVVETGDDEQIYEHPTHPYTQALLSAVPVPDPDARGWREQITLEGEPPSPIDPPSGCRFRTRCWKAQDVCADEEPALIERDGAERDGAGRAGSAHPSACHFAAETEDTVTT
ncbi:ABC transporter ATP-binding protein [Actinomadura sp. 6N118]|uniref:ABC transporter ATP-binding protein n=1 Tax=Actinomadura sp. 6N118 TaxID=3375151 RepID=UPI0037A2714A